MIRETVILQNARKTFSAGDHTVRFNSTVTDHVVHADDFVKMLEDVLHTLKKSETPKQLIGFNVTPDRDVENNKVYMVLAMSVSDDKGQ